MAREMGKLAGMIMVVRALAKTAMEAQGEHGDIRALRLEMIHDGMCVIEGQSTWMLNQEGTK